MSAVLDALPRTLVLVHRDLVSASGRADTGRDAMTAEQVLRALIAKQRFGCSYEELAFLLADSSSVRAFCRVPFSASPPTRSTLQRNIKRVKAATWEQINGLVIADALAKEIETGRTIRSNCTVVVRPAESGGDSYLVDGLEAARHLRSIDAEAYALLTTTPARFHRKQKGFEKILDAPLLSGDDEATFQVCWSYFTLAPTACRSSGWRRGTARTIASHAWSAIRGTTTASRWGPATSCSTTTSAYARPGGVPRRALAAGDLLRPDVKTGETGSRPRTTRRARLALRLARLQRSRDRRGDTRSARVIPGSSPRRRRPLRASRCLRWKTD